MDFKIVLIALLVSAPPALAQTPTPTAPSIAAPIQISAETAKALVPIREQLRTAQYQPAFDALEKLEPAPDVLRLRIQAAVGLEKFDAALSSYDQLSRAIRREEPAALRSIASAVTRSLVRVQDPGPVTAVCESILAETPGDECRKTLEKQTTDSASTPIARFSALAALARTGDRTALARYKAAAATAGPREHRAVIDTVKGLPAEVAVPALAPALASSDGGTQFAAAGALGDFNVPGSKAALQQFLAGSPHPVARGAARLSLARLGDQTMLEPFLASFAELQGGTLLAVGEILRTRKDSRAEEAFIRVVQGDDEMLRVRAAAELGGAKREMLAQATLDSALGGGNPWLRAAALEEFRSSELLSIARARPFLIDQNPWVKLRAVEAVSSRLKSAPPSVAAERR